MPQARASCTGEAGPQDMVKVFSGQRMPPLTHHQRVTVDGTVLAAIFRASSTAVVYFPASVNYSRHIVSQNIASSKPASLYLSTPREHPDEIRMFGQAELIPKRTMSYPPMNAFLCTATHRVSRAVKAPKAPSSKVVRGLWDRDLGRQWKGRERSRHGTSAANKYGVTSCFSTCETCATWRAHHHAHVAMECTDKAT